MSGYHYSPYRNERITDYYESLYAHKYNWDETDNSLKETNRQDSEETDKQCYWKIVKKKKILKKRSNFMPTSFCWFILPNI